MTMIMMSFHIKPEQKAALKALAAKQGKGVGEVLRGLIDAGLETTLVTGPRQTFGNPPLDWFQKRRMGLD